ncbi:MAG TPA: sigma-70 family RNA polymerase sigma factor [Thermoanaerobaculia bacterium]|nr:sigma-70 family RNA polymerase sigma factor [Thermoanaerobaculia bacterium]
MNAASISTSAVVRDADLDLAERHLAGDRTAFDEVYSRYAEMVYNVALRLSGNSDDAADLCQEIFLRIHRHLGGFRGRSALKTWIYRIALNYCHGRFSVRRFAFLRLFEEGEETAAPLPDTRRGPEDLAVAGDEGRRVAGALARLPIDFRAAVVLRDLEGLAYEEIAEVLRVPIGTVRSRIARGRDRLRELLESHV